MTPPPPQPPAPPRPGPPARPAPGSGGGPPPRRIPLGAAHQGVRMDVFLAAELGLSRGQARGLLAAGAVRLEGRTLGPGDKGLALPGVGVVEVAPWRGPADQRVPAPESLAGAPRLVAEGPGWVAVDKPPGMPVHPLHEGETGTVTSYVAARYPGLQGVGEGGLRSGVVHRLDVDTSGVLLVATEAPVWQRLREAFQQHAVEKTYLAIVSGELHAPAAGLEIRLPLVIARHRPSFVRVARDEEIARGRSRVVRQTVSVVETLRDATLVEIRPETGFLHQIRATLAHLGHPLLGDERYAPEPIASGAPRHMLHATHVRFEDVEAHASVPADFEACVSVLRD